MFTNFKIKTRCEQKRNRVYIKSCNSRPLLKTFLHSLINSQQKKQRLCQLYHKFASNKVCSFNKPQYAWLSGLEIPFFIILTSEIDSSLARQIDKNERNKFRYFFLQNHNFDWKTIFSFWFIAYFYHWETFRLSLIYGMHATSVTRLGDFESSWQQICKQKKPKKIGDFWDNLKRSINVKIVVDII